MTNKKLKNNIIEFIQYTNKCKSYIYNFMIISKLHIYK